MCTPCKAAQYCAPQSTVLGHFFTDGLVFGSQLEVLHFTAPGVPDNPSPTPHLVAHPLGSCCNQLPDIACATVNKSIYAQN